MHFVARSPESEKWEINNWKQYYEYFTYYSLWNTFWYVDNTVIIY